MRVIFKLELKPTLTVKEKGGSRWWRKSKQHGWARRDLEPIVEDGSGFRKEIARPRGKSGYPFLGALIKWQQGTFNVTPGPVLSCPTTPAPPPRHPHPSTPRRPSSLQQRTLGASPDPVLPGFHPPPPIMLLFHDLTWPRKIHGDLWDQNTELTSENKQGFFPQTNWWSIIGCKILFCLQNVVAL